MCDTFALDVTQIEPRVEQQAPQQRVFIPEVVPVPEPVPVPDRLHQPRILPPLPIAVRRPAAAVPDEPRRSVRTRKPPVRLQYV